MKITDYDELDELYDDSPAVERIKVKGAPVNSQHNLQRQTENAINRHRRQARKAKDRMRNGDE